MLEVARLDMDSVVVLGPFLRVHWTYCLDESCLSIVDTLSRHWCILAFYPYQMFIFWTQMEDQTGAECLCEFTLLFLSPPSSPHPRTYQPKLQYKTSRPGSQTHTIAPDPAPAPSRAGANVPATQAKTDLEDVVPHALFSLLQPHSPKSR
jgi:hypothetical protein